MSFLLSDKQAEELHKAILAYVTARNLPNSANALREELNLDEDAFDAATAKKYEPLLEKKWTSVVRLQKKIMDLESQNATLQSQLENLAPSALSKRNQDPSSWLPKAPPQHSLESHRGTINCLAFHPIFSSVATGSDDCTIKIWDWEAGELESTIKGHTRAVNDVDFGGPKGAILLASCSSDLTIRLWDPTNDYKNTRTLPGHDHSVSAVRFISPGTLLVSASRDKTLKVWDTSTGYCVRTIQGHSGWVRDVSTSSDGRFLFSTGDDMVAHLWDISTSIVESKATMIGHEHFNECCAIAPSTSYPHLATLAGLKTPPSANSTAEFMATGSRDKTIRLWDSRGSCLATLVGHDNWVRALVFHPGGKYLLSVSDDKSLRCWDLSQGGRCVKVLAGCHERFITSLKWAPGLSKRDSTNNEPLAKRAATADISAMQVRCVVATAGVDSKLRIFAG